jgi:tRNA/rRNA methyltransferase
MLERIRFVLCQTTHPGNIGAAARALKTMGLSRLMLVNPRHFPHEQATAMASGADDLLEQAVVCQSLSQALAGTTWVVGLTARFRDLSHPMASVREVVRQLPQQTGDGDIAFVFGTEMSGLSNAELDCCHYLAHIPTVEDFSSLNLAAAVQVVAYELRSGLLPVEVSAREYPLATHEEVEGFYGQLEEALLGSGFLDAKNPGRMMIRLRRLFSRSRLEKNEVNILRGMIRAFVEPYPPAGSEKGKP